MIENLEEFYTKVKKSRNIYSLKDRLLGRGRSLVEVQEIKTHEVGHYKLIKLTKKGIINGWQRNIETAQQYLSIYSGSNLVPALAYADSNRLVVDWLEGVPLNLLDMKDGSYASLGRFIASSLRDLQIKSSEQIIKKINKQIGTLSSQSMLDTKLCESIACLLSEEATPPNSVAECICFGDTALKNFVRDRNGEFHYVDILGIYRAPVGRVFAKQLSMIPAAFRKTFSLAYEQAIHYPEIEIYLPFYFLLHLVNRIYAKSKKKGFFQRRRGKKKSQLAINDLKSYVQVAHSGKSLTEWIMSA